MKPLSTTRATEHDPRDLPNYGVREAALYLRLPASTLRAWALGQGETFKPVFRIAERRPPTLSFFNLVEGHVLGAIREHVRMQRIRDVLRYVERELGGLAGSRRCGTPRIPGILGPCLVRFC